MQHKSVEFSIESIIKGLNKKGSGKIHLDFPNQRPEGQWTREAQSLLIHTIIQDQIVPELFIVKQAAGQIAPKTVIDGKQRVSTIYQYYNDGFKLHKKTPAVTVVAPHIDANGNFVKNEYGNVEYVEQTFNIAGKKFSQLEKILQELFMDYEFSVRMISDATEDEIVEQMYKLNNGKALTATQRAITRLSVTLAAEIERIAKNDFFEERICFNASQIKNSEGMRIVLQSLILLTGKSYKNMTNADLSRLAQEFNNDWSQAQLDQLNELFLMLNNLLPDNELCQEYLTTANIPVLIMLMDKYCSMVENNEITEEKFREFLKYWFDKGIKSDLYTQYLVKPMDKSNIDGRIDTMEIALLEFLVGNDYTVSMDGADTEEDIISETEISTDNSQPESSFPESLKILETKIPDLSQHSFFVGMLRDEIDDFLQKSRIIADENFGYSNFEEETVQKYNKYYSSIDEYTKVKIEERIETVLNIFSCINNIKSLDKESLLCIEDVILKQIDIGIEEKAIITITEHIVNDTETIDKVNEISSDMSNYIVGRISYLNNAFEKELINK